MTTEAEEREAREAAEQTVPNKGYGYKAVRDVVREEGFVMGYLAALAKSAEREKLWREYVDLLMLEVNSHVALAVAHGWQGNQQRYLRGKMLRAALGITGEGER